MGKIAMFQTDSQCLFHKVLTLWSTLQVSDLCVSAYASKMYYAKTQRSSVKRTHHFTACNVMSYKVGLTL